jgi:secondary thiamine-phosphate synthase enzyme
MTIYKEHTLSTKRQSGFYDITDEVQQVIKASGINTGICLVHCPHTTAAITVNENADPDVQTDLLLALEKTFPDRKEFRHAEGNSAAHLKSSAFGCSAALPVQGGRLVLGRWQGIYFCEFDGPRQRDFSVTVTGEGTAMRLL